MSEKTPGVGFYGKVRIPTIGHKAAIDKAKKIAEKSSAELHIGLSGAAAPLTMHQKATHAKKLFKHPVETNHKHVIDFLSNMHKKHDHFTLVCGSDRAAEYRSILQRYNGNKDRQGNIPFSFKSWDVQPVEGKREDIQKDPTTMSRSELTRSVSASKLEHLARKGNYAHFKAYHPGMEEEHVRRLYDQIRRGITLRESLEPEIGQALSRDLMPQIDNVPGFLSYLKKQGVSSEKKLVKPTNLRSSQAEFDRSKVAEIIQKKKLDPIVSSEDNHVADGHHRWLAGHALKKKIETHQVDLPILDLLAAARRYNTIQEETKNWQIDDLIDSFAQFVYHKLGIKKAPIIKHQEPTNKSFGGYCPTDNSIGLVTKNRHPMDVLRTLAHELVHHKQNEDGRITNASKEGATGSPIEDEANAYAGRLMRWWAKANPDHFNLEALTENIAIIVVGGPCSGKDKVIRNLCEDFDLPELDIQTLLRTAKCTKQFVLNGTADNLNEVVNAKELLEENGYYTSLIFVDTSNTISKLRNEQRKINGQRVLNESIRFGKFTLAQENKEILRKLFEGNMKIIENNVSFDSRIGKGNKPKDREWGKPSTVRIYQNDTPGQGPKDIARWALPGGEKVLAKESAVEQAYTPKKVIQRKKQRRDDQLDPLSNASNDGIGSTFAVNRPPSSSVAAFESVSAWASNPKTQERFKRKYGHLAEQKLAFTVRKLQENITKTVKVQPKSIRKIRESADMGVFDSMGTVDAQNKQTELPPDGKISAPTIKRKKIINKKPAIKEIN